MYGRPSLLFRELLLIPFLTTHLSNSCRVFFGSYDIKTWYYSPYPLEEDDWDSANTPSHGDQNQGHPRKPSGRWPDGSKSKKDPQLDPSSNPTADSSMNPQVNSSNSASLAVHNGATDSTKAGDTNNSSSAAEAPPTSSRKMWVCDGCFKYMRSYPGWTAHKVSSSLSSDQHDRLDGNLTCLFHFPRKNALSEVLLEGRSINVELTSFGKSMELKPK